MHTTIHRPLWQEIESPSYPADRLPERADVIIVGGGITGLTAALLLKRAGKQVLLCEKRRIGSGMSGHTSAHLTYVTDLRITQLIRTFGRDAAERAWRGGSIAISLIESLARELEIECGFHRVPGFLCGSLESDRDESDELREEAEEAASFGFAARFLVRGPIASKPAVSYADQAIFHPLAYLAGLARAVHGDGSMVVEDAEIMAIEQSEDDPIVVSVSGRKVRCDRVLIATHVPLSGIASTLSATFMETKLYPYSTYVLGAALPSSGGLSPGLYSDTSDPYYYLRIHETNGSRYAIFGGQDHKTGEEPDPQSRYDALERMLYRLMPDAVVDRQWSGQVIETPDGLPYIGANENRQFIATGFAGNGLTYGTLAGIMARDAAMGDANPWEELFDPFRKKIKGALGTYVAHNATYPYHLLMDRLREDRLTSPESLTVGDGKVLRVDGRRVACHRGDDGTLYKVDAVCTHMGCLVRWNGAERTWDCPCHGSRFTHEGTVIGGPAEEPLERL